MVTIEVELDDARGVMIETLEEELAVIDVERQAAEAVKERITHLYDNREDYRRQIQEQMEQAEGAGSGE